jgi:hypothetical protein
LFHPFCVNRNAFDPPSLETLFAASFTANVFPNKLGEPLYIRLGCTYVESCPALG